MIRKIIKIDSEKCNGCGLCVQACHEGAIGLVEGKARLLRDDYCDGLGDCLPTCPTGAISFEEREAAPYDEALVRQRQQAAGRECEATLPCGCPGSQARSFDKDKGSPMCPPAISLESELRQWPVQIKLVPLNAPYFEKARLLIAADCAAYSHANFHVEFMRGKITLIGCPKLDDVDYSEKLTAIIARNDIESVTVVRMEVPCCGGIEQAVATALKHSGKMIPWRVITLSTDGKIIKDSGQ